MLIDDGMEWNRHLTLLGCTLRYSLSIAKFSSGSTGAGIAYRLAFLSAAATYGIVVYKAYRARFRSGTMPTGQAGVIKILGDENVQYLRKLSPSLGKQVGGY
jgi:hypothetical protein